MTTDSQNPLLNEIEEFRSKEESHFIENFNCKNHLTTKASYMCGKCENFFCNECIVEYWSHNFLSYAFVGQKKYFIQEFICKRCERLSRIKGIVIALALLIPFLFEIILALTGTYFQ